jgi:LysM repeat protein
MTIYFSLPPFHTVRPGESLRMIAARYGIRPILIISANPGKESRVHAGTPVFVDLVEGEKISLPTLAPFDP